MGSTDTRGVRLQIDRVNKAFGAFEALRPTTIDIEPGEFVSVVGPSGCGKSTLMLMVAGLLKTSQGSIELGDFVVLGGQVGVADHIKIGSGAQVAAKSGVTGSLAGGQVYGGFPAKPIGQWRREMGARGAPR